MLHLVIDSPNNVMSVAERTGLRVRFAVSRGCLYLAWEAPSDLLLGPRKALLERLVPADGASAWHHIPTRRIARLMPSLRSRARSSSMLTLHPKGRFALTQLLL